MHLFEMMASENCMNQGLSQVTFTCLKSTIETLGKGVKYVQS